MKEEHKKHSEDLMFDRNPLDIIKEFQKNAVPFVFPDMPLEEYKEVKKEEPIVPCPVCGSMNIKRNYDHNAICGPGYRSWATSDTCEDCGVLLSPTRRKRDI